MAALMLVLVCLISVVCSDQQNQRKPVHVPETVIQQLFKLVLENQVQNEAPTVSGQVKIITKGSYKSVMKLNHFGDSLQTAQRWAINIKDLNVYVPMWVSIVLLEAHRYGVAPKPSNEQLISTVDFCNGFIDPTKSYNNSLLTFWACLSDETRQSCVARPSAYMELMNVVKKATSDNPETYHTIDKKNLKTVLQTFSDILRIVTGIGNINDLVLNSIEQFENIHVSTDADDTTLWLSFGSTLKMFEDDFSLVSTKWLQYNSNISSIFNALKEFAYRPFSADPVSSTIDPQTYYVLRHFLDDAKAAGKDVALVTTWFTNSKEEQARGGPVHLHKIINDVDITVCANAINAITTAILSGLVSPEVLQDHEVHEIYRSTSEMLAFLINSNFTNRPDLILPYYPSLYQFYWTVARTLSTMNTYKQTRNFPAEVMDLVFDKIKHAMEGEATRFLIYDVKHSEDGSLYFDDLLGNGDVTDDNKPIIRGEDRIYTTSIAVNVLMYTWLTFDSNSGKSHWRPGTPEIVKEIVDGCVLWLMTNIFARKFMPWNVFFAAQNQGQQSLSFRYPANVFTEIQQQYPFQYGSARHTIVAMQGYIPKIQYEAMINKDYFDNPTATVSNDLKITDYKGMLFWTSEACTFAIVLQALSRYRGIADYNYDGRQRCEKPNTCLGSDH